MPNESKTEVLIAGAGPVGMFTAALLAKAGVEVDLFDREPGIAARSYACSLHPATLRLLDRIGLADEVLKAGRRIDRIAFYEGTERRAELKLSSLPSKYPFVVSLPQLALESLLEAQLSRATRTKVHWSHRVAWVRPEQDRVAAGVHQLTRTSEGYSVPTWEWVVGKTLERRASLVVGADGHHSTTRQSLGIEYERIAGPDHFAVYEFESDEPVNDEIRVVLHENTTNVLWPLPGNRFRWSFQFDPTRAESDFPEKDRSGVIIEHKAGTEAKRGEMRRFLGKRAPWFTASIEDISWAVDVPFERRLAKEFGRGRCWLAGDAAHQTAPAAMQSMNVGFREAALLTDMLVEILRGNGGVNLLEDYGREQRAEWRRLLCIDGKPKPRDTASPWVAAHAGKVLPCVPASGEDLLILLNVLGLEFA